MAVQCSTSSIIFEVWFTSMMILNLGHIDSLNVCKGPGAQSMSTPSTLSTDNGLIFTSFNFPHLAFHLPPSSQSTLSFDPLLE